MRLSSYRTATFSSWGVVTDDGLIDVGRALEGAFRPFAAPSTPTRSPKWQTSRETASPTTPSTP